MKRISGRMDDPAGRALLRGWLQIQRGLNVPVAWEFDPSLEGTEFEVRRGSLYLGVVAYLDLARHIDLWHAAGRRGEA